MNRPQKSFWNSTLLVMGPFNPIFATWTNTFKVQYDHDLNSKVVSFDDKTREIPSHLNIGHLTLFLPPGHLDSPSQSLGMSWFYFQLIQPTTHPPTHPSTHPPIHPPTHPTTHPSTHPDEFRLVPIEQYPQSKSSQAFSESPNKTSFWPLPNLPRVTFKKNFFKSGQAWSAKLY